MRQMVKTLAAAGMVAGALALTPGQAHAQAAVVCVSCPTEIQEALRFGKSVAEWAKQLEELKAIYTQAQLTYWAMTNIRDLGTAVQALQMVGISNPLPIDPYVAQALMNGTGGPMGMLSSITSLFRQNTSALTVYDCPAGDIAWVCQQNRRNREGAAGAQALSMQLYQSAAQREQHIRALQAQIAAARTPAEREALMAQLMAANAQIANQQVQATAIGTYSQQQMAMREQQNAERIQEQIDGLINEARRRGIVR